MEQCPHQSRAGRHSVSSLPFALAGYTVTKKVAFCILPRTYVRFAILSWDGICQLYGIGHGLRILLSLPCKSDITTRCLFFIVNIDRIGFPGREHKKELQFSCPVVSFIPHFLPIVVSLFTFFQTCNIALPGLPVLPFYDNAEKK